MIPKFLGSILLLGARKQSFHRDLFRIAFVCSTAPDHKDNPAMLSTSDLIRFVLGVFLKPVM